MPTNKILGTSGDSVTFKNSGGTVAMTLTAIAHDAPGRVSAQWDRGSANARPICYRCQCNFKMSVAGSVGDTIELYYASAHSNAAVIDGSFGQSDAAFTSADLKRNLTPIGSVQVQTTGASDTHVATFTTYLRDRYISLVVFMTSTTGHLSTTANDSFIVMTPIVDDIQAAA